jgi:tetraacyldisaccharide 4'-kinase
VIAVAGIANSQRFFDALKTAGHHVVDTLGFGDHHRYTRADVAAIAAKAQSSGATAVFTTDKDAVRFEALDVPFPLYRVPLSVTFEPADTLFASVKTVLQ